MQERQYAESALMKYEGKTEEKGINPLASGGIATHQSLETLSDDGYTSPNSPAFQYKLKQIRRSQNVGALWPNQTK